MPNRWTKRLRTLLHRDAVERELDEELAFHIEMETQKNLRAGMGEEEARRRAALAFGGVTKHREAVRDARWLGWLGGTSLDARLGARMLWKYPGLTLVGTVGMAVAIAIGAVFDASAAAMDASPTLPDGERLVALEVWDAEINNQEPRIAHDLEAWRDQLRTVRSVGAYRSNQRNLIVPGGSTEPVTMAEMSAAGFEAARVPPLLGRPLVEADEAPGAPHVVVLGHDVWLSRFGGEPDVIGREVRIGRTVHQVVGVMPAGFAFPLNHRLWIPLRLDAGDLEPRQGPYLQAFGVLAAGATLADARAELASLGAQAALASPETHEHLRPRVLRYGPHLLDDMQGWELPVMRALLTLLLLVICVNVAVLVYARTATRAGEITVRTALGASRLRIVTQFFAESLVLTGIAAALGLAVAAFSLSRIESAMERMLAPMGGLPFWMDLTLSGRTLLYVVGLAGLAALVIGIVPALQATGRRVQGNLRALGGGTGMRLGRTWTLLITAQVAITVAMLPAVIYHAAEFLRIGVTRPDFPAGEYLSLLATLDREAGADEEAPAEPGPFAARYTDRVRELASRLAEEREVSALAFTLHFPGEEPTVSIALDAAGRTRDPAEGEAGHPVRFNRVDPGFFETFDLPVLSGRALEPADLGPAATPVVVNRGFVDEILGGESPLGRRFEYSEGFRSGGVMHMPEGVEEGTLYEIVGVVDDLLRVEMEPGQTGARVYHPLAPGTYPIRIMLRTRGAPVAFVPRLRDLAAAIEPALQLRQMEPMDRRLAKMQGALRLSALALGLLAASVLLLSAAGIYALMSFTVTQRRREIGIRSALGADPRRLLAGIFSRAAGQLGVGAAAGLGIALLLNAVSQGEMTGGEGRLVLPVVALIMLAVGLAATLGPARRGLRIEPMEALRAE